MFRNCKTIFVRVESYERFIKARRLRLKEIFRKCLML